MSSVALTSISIIIGAFFVLFGILKVAPLFSADLYHDMRGIFARSAKIFPLQSLTGWRPDPDAMRRIYGAIEMVSGVVMMVAGETVADVANATLMGLILFTLYGNWALGEGLKEASHGIVLGLVLTCRFVIRLQTLQKNDDDDALKHDGVDAAFRMELRRRIAELHESVCKTKDIIEENSKADKTLKTTKRKKQAKAENRVKKQNPPAQVPLSKKND
ncbi:unnamed protein product [Mesocestoides corti]|nr:unnamed protein product [Mesocestoides corti]